MKTPEPVPDHLWKPVVQQREYAELLMRVFHWCYAAGAVAILVDKLIAPRNDAFFHRLILPLWLAGTVVGLTALVTIQLSQRRARRLMIEYHGIDPEDPARR